MSKSQRGGQPLELAGGPLGDLSFQWSGDRYVHSWRFADSSFEVALTSVESDSDALWPLSPPLQQIHRQSFGDGREVVFGVGMAGRGHWSASFTLVPDLKCWIVELACRASAEPTALNSTYHLSGHWRPAEDGTFRCDSDGSGRDAGGLCVEPITPSSTAELDGAILTIRPNQTSSNATTQWAFRLRA